MTPLAIFAVVVAVSLLVFRLRRPRARTGGRLVVGVTGAALLFAATGTSLATVAQHNFAAHMTQHVVLMFVVPIALTYSGGLRAWWWILPVSTRRKLLRAWFRHRPSASAPRAVTGFLALNIVMVVTHVPVVFDYLLARSWAINVILDPAYVIAGLLFFRSLVPSSPRRVRSRMREQAAMVVGTMLIMFVSALSMSVFTKHAWFHVANYAHGFDFHFQQLGAGILWICGDFWAVPLLAVIVRRVIQRDGSLFSVLDARLPSGSAR